MGRHKTELYFLTEDETLAFKARMLELGYASISELARRLDRNPSNVASILIGETAYPKSLDDELKELGFNIVHHYTKPKRFVARADRFKLRRELARLGYEGTKNLMSAGYKEANMISGNAVCTKRFIKDMYDMGIDIQSLCRMTDDKYVQPCVDPKLVDDIISNVPGIDRIDKIRNAYRIIADALCDEMYKGGRRDEDQAD